MLPVKEILSTLPFLWSSALVYGELPTTSPEEAGYYSKKLSAISEDFDALYEEGKTKPKMMSVGLHCRLIGRPGRIQSLRKFLDYVLKHDDVWICKRIDIAKHWIKNYQNI